MQNSTTKTISQCLTYNKILISPERYQVDIKEEKKTGPKEIIGHHATFNA